MTVNPFVFSAPVGLDDLIDRDDETELLLATARGRNNSRLVAPRRYGKTSLVRRVLGEVAAGPDAWHAVYVDLFGVLSLGDVADRVERAYRASLTGRLARWFDALRRTTRPTVTARTGPLSVSAHLDASAHGLADLLDMPLRLHERTGRPTLVAFDEFQELLAVPGSADAVVRSSIQHHGDAAAYVFAGSHAGMMTRLFADRRRAFYAQARPVLLPPLPAADCSDYIDDRFTASGKDVGDALAPLLDLGAGHPQRTMLLAHALWEAAPAGEAAGVDTFATALDRVLVDLGDELRVVWSTSSPAERRVLAAVATGRPPYGASSGGTSGGQVSAAIDGLVGRGDLYAEGSPRRRFRLVDPLLGEWLRRQSGADADAAR